MAGTCVGNGLTLDGNGHVALKGARVLEWADAATCPIESYNGLNVDPVTGNAWAGPRVAPHYEVVQGSGATIAPANDSDKDLGTMTLQHTVGPCGQRRVIADVAGGYNAYRMASGNFWLVTRYATLYVDNVPVYFTGSEIVTACENNSGGITSQGGPIEVTPFSVVLDPGQTVKIVATHTLSLPGFAANGANSFVWRPPHIRATFLPIPT